MFLEGGGDECVLMESWYPPTATPPPLRWSWRMTRAGPTGAFQLHSISTSTAASAASCILELLHPACRACRLPLSALCLPCVHMECRRILFFCMTRRRQRRPGWWHNDSGRRHPNAAACCLLYLPEIYTGLPTRFLSLHTMYTLYSSLLIGLALPT
jgi:hypothetical protein